MVEGEYPPAFPLMHQLKDLRLALELASSERMPVPLAKRTEQIYYQAYVERWGEFDFSAVKEVRSCYENEGEEELKDGEHVGEGE